LENSCLAAITLFITTLFMAMLTRAGIAVFIPKPGAITLLLSTRHSLCHPQEPEEQQACGKV
jgi:hypothetical protein